MKYDRNTASPTIVRRSLTYTLGQQEALVHIKRVNGVPVAVSIRRAIDDYLEKLLPKQQ